MERRTLILGGVAAISAWGGLEGGKTAFANADAMVATVEYQGQTFRFDEAGATDLGDYVDPQGRFVQNCRCAIIENLPLSVYFRRDRGSDRVEVVFELGRIRHLDPNNMGSYKVTIQRGSILLYSTPVPNHFWFARWRWQSSPRKVTARISELTRTGLLPAFDMPARQRKSRTSDLRSYQIMGLAGITGHMPSTGDRRDIGPLTEPQAEYVIEGSSSALESLLAQAEGANTLPWCLRDENTGAPIDFLKYPKATVYGPEDADPFIRRAQTGMLTDSAHQPALSYLPFLLTGDPYYLETLQFQAVFNVLEQPPGYRFVIGQERAYAWSMRTLGQLVRVMPEKTPGWLLPRSTFNDLFNTHRDRLLKNFVYNSDVVRAVFRTPEEIFGGHDEHNIEAHTYIAPFTEEFLALILGWLVRMGFEDWRPIFAWKLGSTVARTNGRSGWNRAMSTPFRIVLREHRDAPWAKSWSEAWALNERVQNFSISNPDHADLKPVQFTSFVFTRGALAMACQLGDPNAKSCFDWVDSETRELSKRGMTIPYRWSLSA